MMGGQDMLTVKTLEEAEKIVQESCSKIHMGEELLVIHDVNGRMLAQDICSKENVPSFHRSSVDGYALIAKDTFGASDAVPAILDQIGKVEMGVKPLVSIKQGTCAYVPTGGQIPDGADAMVMLEYTEDYEDGTIGVLKSCAPGGHFVYCGDDMKEGAVALTKGTKIGPKEIGVLAALGVWEVPVKKIPTVGIISTGDELVPCSEIPKEGQVRDVNAPMLAATVQKMGCKVKQYGIIKDEYEKLKETIEKAVEECDMLLLSGGTSVGEKDVTSKIIEELGTLLIHGIALKPGKPTIFGKIKDKPVFGMPGHPVAAFFVFYLLTRKLICEMKEESYAVRKMEAKLTCAVSSNQGREECIGVTLKNGYAEPIIGKSGLISTLIHADGYIRIARDCEGIGKGENVIVNLFEK